MVDARKNGFAVNLGNKVNPDHTKLSESDNYYWFSGAPVDVYIDDDCIYVADKSAGLYVYQLPGLVDVKKEIQEKKPMAKQPAGKEISISNVSVNSIFITKTKMYAGTSFGLAMSNDYGKTWYKINIVDKEDNKDYTDKPIKSVLVTGEEENEIWVSFYDVKTTLVSLDDGVSWQKPIKCSMSFYMKYGDFPRVTLKGYSDAYNKCSEILSTEHNLSKKDIEKNIIGFTFVKDRKVSSDITYVLTPYGIYKFDLGGTVAEKVTARGLENKKILSIFRDLENPQKIFVGVENDGIYISTDGGNNFNKF